MEDASSELEAVDPRPLQPSVSPMSPPVCSAYSSNGITSSYWADQSFPTNCEQPIPAIRSSSRSSSKSSLSDIDHSSTGVLRPASGNINIPRNSSSSITTVKPNSKAGAKLDLSGEQLEIVLAELEIRLKRLHQLEDYRNDQAYRDLDYIKAATRYGKYRSKERITCFEKLNELHVVALFSKIYAMYFHMEKFHRVLRDILVVIWNGTDSCVAMCQSIIDSGLHTQILSYLGEERINPNESILGNLYVIKGLLGIVNNLARLVETSPSMLRDCLAIETLTKFRESKHLMVRCKTELILAYIMTEKQYEEMDSKESSINFFVKMLSDALESPEHHSKKYGFSADEIIQGLNKIAVSDSNKLKIVQSGALKHYAALMKSSCSQNENFQAARGIWILAFKCSEDIKKEAGCVEGIKSLTEHGDPGIRKHASGALWLLEGRNQQSASTSDLLLKDDEDASPHVFISYQWGNQATMLQVRDRLQQSGYKVWMDVDAMSGSILEAMALAVEQAAVVIICMSQKYKESPNCRTEAEYTFRQQKAIIPLRLQNRYFADGWLGALVGNKLFFDFSVENKFEKSIAGLMRELGDRGKTKAAIMRGESVDGVVSPAIVPSRDSALTSASPLDTARNWSSDRVMKWVTKMRLGDSSNWFDDVDGETLFELVELHRDAPEFYYSTLKSELHMSLKQILKFTGELKKLK